MRDADIHPLLTSFGDPIAMQFYPATKSRAQVLDWIEANRARYATDGFGLWAVELRATGDVIGDCGITLQPVEGVVVPEIGYRIVRSEWGRGFATEAAMTCRDWFFASTAGQRVVSIVDPANVASRRWERAGGREMCLYETTRAWTPLTTLLARTILA